MFENYNQVLNQLLDAGLLVSHLEVDSHRMKRVPVNIDLCPVDREKQKSAGWYKLNSFSISGKNYIVGSFGWWKGGDNNAQKVQWDKTVEITQEDRQAIAARHKQAQKEAEAARQREADKAAARAQNAWRVYQQDGQCDYLTKKKVKAYGVRFDHKGAGTMAVPMMDVKGQIQGLQIIRGSNSPAGKPSKQYWPQGLSKVGHFHLIGMPVDVCLVAEGYATAASIHEATGLPIAVAFDAGNLKPVCEAIQKHYPKTKIVICADDDYLTEGNPGVTKAQQAALTVGGAWVKPDFSVAGRDIRDGKKLTDFNDLHTHPEGGLHLVSAQIAEAVKAVGIRQKVATAAKSPSEGAGEKRKAALSVMPLEDIVDRFMHVDDDTGDYAYDNWTQSIVKFSKITKMLPAGVRIDDIKRHPVWLNRAVYIDQIGFDPTEKDANIICNRWNGWPTNPNPQSTPKECESILGLLAYLCSGEANSVELTDWILNWMAYPIQNPGAKMQSAIVMHGPQGTGKSLLWETYAKIYGEYSIVLNQGAIEDKFNSDWSERKLFVVADEIVARSEMHHLKNQLKGLITGEWVRINPKNVAAHQERNHMNLVFLSNEHQPVVLENDDRRHCVVWTPKKLPDSAYEKINHEIDNGGIAALHQFLLTLDLGDFKPWTKPPLTQAKQDLIETNLDSPQLFITDYLTGQLGAPVGPVKSADLYASYLAWCKRSGERFPRAIKQFVPYIKNLGWYVGLKDCWDSYKRINKLRTRVIIPNDDAINQAKLNQATVIEKRADQTDSDWVTHGVLQFQNATVDGADFYEDSSGY